MKSIPVGKSRLSDNKSKFLYLKKGESVFRFFIAFLKCEWNLDYSEKKEEYPRLIFTEFIASERNLYLSF